MGLSLKRLQRQEQKMTALLEIAVSFGVWRVERKFKNLVCHFLHEIKKRDGIKSGAGRDIVYKSK